MNQGLAQLGERLNGIRKNGNFNNIRKGRTRVCYDAITLTGNGLQIYSFPVDSHGVQPVTLEFTVHRVC